MSLPGKKGPFPNSAMCNQKQAILIGITMLLWAACAGAAGRVPVAKPTELLPFSVDWSWAADEDFTQNEFQSLLGELHQRRPRYAAGSPSRYRVAVSLVNRGLWYNWPQGFTGYSFGVLHADVIDSATGTRLCERTVKMSQEIGKPLVPTRHAYLAPWMTGAMVEMWDRIAGNPCATPRTSWLASPPGTSVHPQLISATDDPAEAIKMEAVYHLSFLQAEDVPALLKAPPTSLSPATTTDLLFELLVAELDGMANLPDRAARSALLATPDQSKDQMAAQIATVLAYWETLGSTPETEKKRSLIREVWRKNPGRGVQVLVNDLNRVISGLQKADAAPSQTP